MITTCLYTIAIAINRIMVTSIYIIMHLCAVYDLSCKSNHLAKFAKHNYLRRLCDTMIYSV